MGHNSHVVCTNHVTGLKITASRRSLISVQNDEMTGQTSNVAVISQGPHSHILMTGVCVWGGGGGGSGRGSYFIPKKITTPEFVCPKKSLIFLAYPKKSLSPFFTTQKKSLCFFCDQKNPGVFHHFGPKFQTPKKSLGSPPPRH